ITARLRESHGVDVQAMHSDDGIVLRLPDSDEPPSGAAAVFDPAEVEERVRDEVGGSALFASRFRECAARALLLPKRNPQRRSPQALPLDSALLAELLGQAELRELLDPDALAEVEAELQRLVPERHAHDAEGVADLLRVLGALTTAEAVERGATPAWLASLEETRRAIRVRIAGEERWA